MPENSIHGWAVNPHILIFEVPEDEPIGRNARGVIRVHFICDEQNLIHAGPLQIEMPGLTILDFFTAMITYRLPHTAGRMCNPRCWIIRVNREPVKSGYVLQEGDEILIGGQHVEHLPWKLHIREPNYMQYWLRWQYRPSKQRAHCADYMIFQQPSSVSHNAADFCVDFITRGNLAFPRIPTELLLPRISVS